MRFWSKRVTALAVGCASLVVPAAPAISAPPDYVVTGDACQNHTYYFMGWAHVESDCLSNNALTLGEDNGRPTSPASEAAASCT